MGDRDHVDGQPHPKGDEWFKKPLSDREADALLNLVRGGGGGGGSTRSTGGWNPYQLSMMAGLLIFTALGSRILAELARIRRKLS
ncbi:MAG: hypothetical protein ACRD0W_00170 [Acidimicrobiales bacterium]